MTKTFGAVSLAVLALAAAPALGAELPGKFEGVTIDAKLVVVGMTATQFSIADPADPGMLDVVGFDAAAPEIISQFVRGTI